MSDYVVIYERGAEGWWAYLPDLPGCTSFGKTREDVEGNIREAVAMHVELLRSLGAPVPAPTAHDTGRVAV